MGNKERLKGILERQAAAAERERLDEEAASAKAEKVRSVRVEVIQKWQDASSIAGLLVTTEAMVAERPKKDSGSPAMPGGMGGMDY